MRAGNPQHWPWLRPRPRSAPAAPRPPQHAKFSAARHTAPAHHRQRLCRILKRFRQPHARAPRASPSSARPRGERRGPGRRGGGPRGRRRPPAAARLCRAAGHAHSLGGRRARCRTRRRGPHVANGGVLHELPSAPACAVGAAAREPSACPPCAGRHTPRPIPPPQCRAAAGRWTRAVHPATLSTRRGPPPEGVGRGSRGWRRLHGRAAGAAALW
mmetsp:Transcript_78961/g.226300  ORF Transcript_78961/g.226300 Transcript_78961/m.226300 type:complete len:215 (+) Transcript_78961:138-782(+)